MKNTTEQFSDELSTLESQVATLENQARSCGLAVPTRPDVSAAKQPGATLDEMFGATAALESHAARLRVATRLATPLSSVHGSTPPPKAAATATKPLTQQLRDGDVTAEQVNKGSEILRLESLLAAAKPGTTTHAALASKVSTRRAELDRLLQSTPKK